MTESINYFKSLPAELVIKIFEYLPDRWNVSLVCRGFYEFSCIIERNFYKLAINDPVKK